MKIGIFGGSFNPPHKMHLDIGCEMVSHGYVDKVIYVPTGKKYPKSSLLDDHIRYEMTKFMTEEHENLEVSDFELQNHLVYTYQTLAHFKALYKEDEIYFILGSDLYSEFSTWRNYESILNEYKILVVLRDDDSVLELSKLYENIDKNVIFTDVHPFVLSSTKIRDAISRGDFDYVKEYLSPKVYNFILGQNLYKKDEKED